MKKINRSILDGQVNGLDYLLAWELAGSKC